MKKIKLNKKTKNEIDKAIAKIIKDYGCVLMALQFDDEGFITECEKSNHTLYHNPGVAYNLEINC